MKHLTTYLHKIQNLGLAAMLVVSLGITMIPTKAHAATAATSLTQKALVTFTFDDSIQSAYTLAAPTLAKYGITGTDYVITHCVEMTTTPNTCLADPDVPYMTWAQVVDLQNTYHWNIGSHTQDHIFLASNGGGEQSYIPTHDQIVQQLDGAKADLAAHNITALDFAAPYGDYNNDVLAVAARDYITLRGFADVGYNAYPYNDRLIVNQQIEEGTTGSAPRVTYAMAKQYVDDAIANKQWLTLTFHNITAAVPTNSDNYSTSNALLDQIAAYVKTQVDAGKIAVVSPHDAVVNGTVNMFGDGTFDTTTLSTDWQNRNTAALATSWVTDDQTGNLVKKDTASNGSYVMGNPTSATNSLYISAAAATTHIWAPRVAVNPNDSYVIKGYFNITNFTPGTATQPEVAYRIEQFDANGVLLTTNGDIYASSAVRYDGTNVNAIRVKNANFVYKPSAGAAFARVYIDVQGGGGITGYMDNLEMFSQTSSAQPGDINGDGKVNLNDLSILSNNWNSTTATAAQGDLNGDGKVNLNDLSILSNNWSK
jgi:peptidoglycan/xylan/chitin deacetylase (PgdA/CDA1 family)